MKLKEGVLIQHKAKKYKGEIPDEIFEDMFLKKDKKGKVSPESKKAFEDKKAKYELKEVAEKEVKEKKDK